MFTIGYNLLFVEFLKDIKAAVCGRKVSAKMV